MSQLIEEPYLKFPFQVTADGPRLSNRREHVREQIEQVLFTNPGERVYRAEFGAGVRSLVFEPNSTALVEVTKQRLISSLAAALHGEVDPKSLRVDVQSSGEHGERLLIEISYALAKIGQNEKQHFEVSTGVGSHG
ncbi:MAG: GPW/gp25 family protein [Planctomycetota bacterium]|jgi:phage baseplate assembly protein W